MILKRLRRITVSTNYLPEIDGLRFIAILAVILVHLSDDLVLRHGIAVSGPGTLVYNVLAYPNRGVLLFFSISGFILSLPFAGRYLHAKPAPDLRRYFRRRLLRLEPPYALSVIVCTIATFAVVPSLRPHLFRHMMAAFSYSHGYLFHYRNPINNVWWSLEVETQFYVLMPLLALVYRIPASWLRRGVLLLGMAAAVIVQEQSTSWLFTETLLGFIQYFLAGLLAADLYLTGVFRPSAWLVWDLAGIPALAAVFLLPEHRLQPVAPLLLLVLGGALSGRILKQALARPWIAAIGGMCYTIYLWHMFVMSLVLKGTLRLLPQANYLFSMTLELVFMLPVLFAVSVGLFLFLEKPCMEPDWPNRLRASWNRWRGPNRSRQKGEGAARETAVQSTDV